MSIAESVSDPIDPCQEVLQCAASRQPGEAGALGTSATGTGA